MHRLSTFADRKHVKQAFGKYLTTLIVTFVLNLAVLDLHRRELGCSIRSPARPWPSALVTLVSYMLQKHWVFRSHGRPAAEAPKPPRNIDLRLEN